MKLTLNSLLTASLVLVSPLLSAQDENASNEDSTERICISVRAIRSFDAFSDRHLYVREGSNKHYLFTMRPGCRGLRNSTGIAIKDASNRVCSDGFGEIIYRDRMSSQQFESCLIDTIERAESKDDAKAMAGAGSKTAAK